MKKSWLTSAPFAHRGIHDNIDTPENTMPAFVKAMEAGYGIELDIHWTTDGNLIVFHDDNLLRMCGTNIKTKDIDTKRLSDYRLLGTTITPPLLKDVLKAVDGKVGLIIEVKMTPSVKTTMKLLFELLDDYNGNYCIESFDPFVLTWLKKNRPEVMRGQLASAENANKNMLTSFLSKLPFARKNQPNFIAYDIKSLPNKYVDKFMSANPDVLLITWTVKDTHELNAALTYADNYIFENIDPSKIILNSGDGTVENI